MSTASGYPNCTLRFSVFLLLISDEFSASVNTFCKESFLNLGAEKLHGTCRKARAPKSNTHPGQRQLGLETQAKQPHLKSQRSINGGMVCNVFPAVGLS